MSNNQRKCGVLLHPVSFPSPFGIGDMGIEAREVLSKLAGSGVQLWQTLPLGPTGFGDSPYASLSCFAGNELLIDIRSIKGLDLQYDMEKFANGPRIDYGKVYQTKLPLLKKAAKLYLWDYKEDSSFVSFCKENQWWLDDYALFRSLVDYYNDSRWFLWPQEIKLREPKALEEWTEKLEEQVNTYKVLQFFFFTQWNSLKDFVHKLGMEIIGDIPMFVASDSVDAWTGRNLFKIDNQGNQKAMAGVPPDSFSAEGQLWGNPVYDWKEHEKDDFAWWRKRLEMTFKMVDIVRIDHFRGFEAYWEVPAGEKTAVVGAWKKGPGMKLLKYFKGQKIIAEDLGVITEQVNKLRLDSNWPGMKIFQFAFDFKNGDINADNAYLPHNYEKNFIAYTGTHDNETTRGWFDNLYPKYQDIVRRYLQCPNEEVVWQMIRNLCSSVADNVVIPMQDLIGLGDEARMNLPSTVGVSNWSWRLQTQDVKDWMLTRLKEFLLLYGRMPD